MPTMGEIKALLAVCLLAGLTAADERQKRQANYPAAYGGNYAGAAAYRQPQQGYQQQPQQAYQQPQQAYGGNQQVQHYPAQAPRPARQPQNAPDEEEKEEGPHPLQLLLEKSKFDCGGKSDGYYADSDVGCQAFHYCVSGQKHSMMCPAGTVFHQVHLNCVPSDQDICSKANKFFFVNDYLNKPLEQKGPNNTVLYHQRYYPEGYAVGDPFIPPQQEPAQKEAPAATYGLGPAYREQSPQPQPIRPQQVAPAHRPQPAPYTPQQQQVYAPQQRPAYQQHQPARPVAYQQAPRQPAPQAVAYGYGAQQEQAHQAQALQAQRAYAQQQYQAAAPQQHLYDAAAAQRARYGHQQY